MYGRLQHEARASHVVDAGEIGWRIAARSAWLWTFATPRLTVYRIAQSRGHQVIEHVLGEAFAGTLVSDGLPPYDAVRAQSRQLCTAHLLERCFSRLEEQKTRGAVRFPRPAASVLHEAALHGHRCELSSRAFAASRAKLEGDLDRRIAPLEHCVRPESIKA